jgi:type III pantothenate kinase
MKLLIDAGNTRAKWACCPALPFSIATHFKVATLENSLWLNEKDHSDAQALHAAIQEADEIWISNVAGADWLQRLESHTPGARVILIKATASALGLQNNYIDPAQLGSDRWCSLLAAWQLHRKNALVVTAGTAMTIDALIVENPQAANFAGGSIQPGLKLMWQSLQQGAAQLDYAYSTSHWPENGLALNSQQAMLVGCVQAMVAPIVAQYAQLTKMTGESPLLVLSGGDAAVLQRYLPESLSAQAIIVDNLVLKGLAYLAESV